ncbi:response regulator, partial [Rhodovulum sulfidophilum]|nr:fused response regulator/phosphatase [Rhodovulum sulfidophilum]
KSETVEMIHGLDVGADEFLTKPVNSSELRARIASGERILRMEHQLRDKNRQLTDALAELRTLYDALDRDLAEARKLQQSLVPERHRRFGASEVSLLLRPCGQV